MSESNGKNGHADFVFSVVKGIKDDFPSDTTFRQFMLEIRNGKWRELVERLRDVHAEARKTALADGLVGKALDDAIKKKTREIKLRLPGACFSGTFSYRDAEHLLKPSGLICADLDHLNERVEGVRDLLCADPHTLGCAISPSGTGLKVIFRIDPARPHIESFRATERFVRERFGEYIDGACKEINRLCFVTYDPDTFIADHAEVIPYPPQEPAPEPPQIRLARRDFPAGHISTLADYNARGDWQSILIAHGWTKAHEPYWIRPGKDTGISASWDVVPGHFHVFTDSAPPLDAANHLPCAIFAKLECAGNFKMAFERLYELGYGTRRKEKPAPLPTPDHDTQARLDADAETGGSNGTGNQPAGGDRTHPAHPATQKEDTRAKATAALRALCYARAFNFAVIPKQPIPRFIVNNNHVATPGNLCTILGQSKACKSTYQEAMIAAVIAADQGNAKDCDCLGISATPPAGLHLLHFDTEQSIYDHDQLIRRALRRAQADTCPAWLHSFCLTGFSIPDCRRLVRLLLEDMQAIGGTFAALIDGVADLAVNVNDPEECNPLVAELHEAAITFDCSIICNIHENPGLNTVGKGRGHLGSQLERKAESNLRLKKVDDVITVFSEKMRRGSILEKDGPTFKWDHQAKMHLSCASKGDVKATANRDKLISLAEAVFAHTSKKSLSYSEFTKAVAETANVSADRAETRFTDIRKADIIFRDLVGRWSLKQEQG